jgi:beta-galactosidase
MFCPHANAGRERVSLNAGWRFSRFLTSPDSLSYTTLEPWILPSGNDFISGAKHQRPSGAVPGSSVQYVQASFDDSAWEIVNVPHDWGIKGPFNSPGSGGGGMGRLPVGGVGWYRRRFRADAAGNSVFLDIDGAMSYAAVWLNGNLVGGWPYGYNSFRLDLTPYLTAGDNLLAIRLDNAADNSRWYPGAGLYRNIWLVTVDLTHVAQYGAYITTPSVSAQSATLSLAVDVENKANASREVQVKTEVFVLNPSSGRAQGPAVAAFPQAKVTVAPGAKASTNSSTTVTNPQLWGPPPSQKPNLYIARTTVYVGDNNTAIDTYETTFGIRSVAYDANKGLLVNGQHVRIQGTCNHHDHGALGSAFHVRAAERQLQMLQEMGSNALRTSHNPPAPELLELADQMGYV